MSAQAWWSFIFAASLFPASYWAPSSYVQFRSLSAAVVLTIQWTVASTDQPMLKQGAIILGTGGDNSNGAEGNFYEGYIATNVTSAETDDAIQANIVGVGYKTLPSLHCTEVGKSACYMDNVAARVMGDVVMASAGMTHEQCMLVCFSRNRSLAGVEDGSQCMCGDSVPNPVPSTNCTVACLGGDGSELCGGWMAINVMHFTCKVRM